MLALTNCDLINTMTDSEKPEIRGWFVPRVVPYGGAPEHIKQQWVDVPLPIRYDRPSEGPEPLVGKSVASLPGILTIEFLDDSVTINSVDAIKALKIFGKHEAAEWWERYYRGESGNLGFAIAPEDEIVPASYLQIILPGIEEFDQTNP